MRLALAAVLSICLVALPAAAKGPAYTDPSRTDEDFSFQGEYSGVLAATDQKVKIGVQVIALGQGNFEAVGYRGGLPGDGWNPQEEPHRTEGRRRGDVLEFKGDRATAVLKNGELTITTNDGVMLGSLKKVNRTSNSLGQRPPERAKVLFDGSDAEQWEKGKVKDELLLPGTTSKPRFGSHKLHVEFRLPYQPEDRGQARGNSGVYLQGRYEVQMLDSFGLEGKQNECGGLYSVKDPDLNMCFPPLSWQTFDIDFTAAQYKDGEITKNPRVTVRHNGVVIHDDVELPGNRNTTAAPQKPGPEIGPVYLQNHNNPVRYRNIWVVEK